MRTVLIKFEGFLGGYAWYCYYCNKRNFTDGDSRRRVECNNCKAVFMGEKERVNYCRI